MNGGLASPHYLAMTMQLKQKSAAFKRHGGINARLPYYIIYSPAGRALLQANLVRTSNRRASANIS